MSGNGALWFQRSITTQPVERMDKRNGHQGQRYRSLFHEIRSIAQTKKLTASDGS